MKLEAVIFDLDNTLAPTNKLKDIRERGAYEEIDADLLNKIKPYEKSHELLTYLKSKGIKTGIVTNSGRRYAEMLLKHFQLPSFDVVITYTDVGSSGKKPDPKGIRMALQAMGIQNPKNVLYIGDEYTDIIASYYADVIPIVPSWASTQPVSQVPAAVLSSSFIKDECDSCENIILMAEKSAEQGSFHFPRKRLYFLPLDASANIIPMRNTLSTICLGRYFSQKSLITTRLHDSHELSKEIAKKEHVEDYTPPDYWSDILAHAVDKIPGFFSAEKPFDIVTIIPAKKEKQDRLELVLSGASKKAKANSSFISDLFVFEDGAKSLKTLPKDQRAIEIESSLNINPKYQGQLNGKTVLVFDDVITTGSTLKRAYSILDGEAVKHHLGLCLAKTVSISEVDRLCPKCHTHILKIRTNSSSGIRFWGCSGYTDEKEKCNYTEDIVEKKCPVCERDMVKKFNKHKKQTFLSCTGWNKDPSCNHTEND